MQNRNFQLTIHNIQLMIKLFRIYLLFMVKIYVHNVVIYSTVQNTLSFDDEVHEDLQERNQIFNEHPVYGIVFPQIYICTLC